MVFTVLMMPGLLPLEGSKNKDVPNRPISGKLAYACDICLKEFDTIKKLEDHPCGQSSSSAKRRKVEASSSNMAKSTAKRRKAECPVCHIVTQANVLPRHMLIHNPSEPCKFCTREIRIDKLLKHEMLCKDGIDERLCDRSCVEELSTPVDWSSISGYFRSYKLDVPDSKDYDQILVDTCKSTRVLLEELIKSSALKVQIVIELTFM